MHSAFLLLGSNLGNREELLSKARLLINNEAGSIVSCSSLYETEPWGSKSEYESEIVYNFLNQVILIDTKLAPDELLKNLRKIERELGREKDENAKTSSLNIKKRWDNRTIDIDILFYDDSIVKTEELIIPHPYIINRKFVLIPLNEIAPGHLHPVLNKTTGVLLKECEDKGNVMVYKEKGCN